MYEGWLRFELDRLPVVHEELGPIHYKLFVKKDSSGNYWIISYSVKQPAFRYVGCVRKSYKDIMESNDIEKISQFLIGSGMYISYSTTDRIEKIFTTLTAWNRGRKGSDRIACGNVWFDAIREYLENYTKDEDIIQTIYDSLAIFCKD